MSRVLEIPERGSLAEKIKSLNLELPAQDLEPRAVEELKANVETINQNIETLKEQKNNTDAKNTELKNQMDRLQQAYRKLEYEKTNVKKKNEDLLVQLDNLRGNYNELLASKNKLEQDVQQLRQQVTDCSTNSQEFQRLITQKNTELKEIETQIDYLVENREKAQAIVNRTKAKDKQINDIIGIIRQLVDNRNNDRSIEDRRQLQSYEGQSSEMPYNDLPTSGGEYLYLGQNNHSEHVIGIGSQEADHQASVARVANLVSKINGEDPGRTNTKLENSLRQQRLYKEPAQEFTISRQYSINLSRIFYYHSETNQCFFSHNWLTDNGYIVPSVLKDFMITNCNITPGARYKFFTTGQRWFNGIRNDLGPPRKINLVDSNTTDPTEIQQVILWKQNSVDMKVDQNGTKYFECR